MRRRRSSRLLVLAVLVSALPVGPASLAQTPSAPAPAAQDAASFSLGFDVTLRLREDRSGEYLETRRIEVRGVAAPQRVAQQSQQYTEGMQDFEIVAAFTEKPDGKRIHVDPATVITRDPATGLGGVYLRDLKVATVIFPDVSVGDALVLTTRKTIHSGVFAGHFEHLISFPRAVPYADSTVRVIAPTTLPLRIGVQGMAHSTVTEAGETRHVVTYRAQSTMAAEDQMTSPLDRDPRVSISTFASYEELARSYWGPARSAIEVTPDIARLAEEITGGIADRRDQARAISHWVKTNIRYVMVVLGASRVVPNSAPSVLKNRYGDCKDHAVLMSALLAAKGIAVEHVLINADSAYTLPEPATMGYINHVMLYLPEFDVYDDPTVQFASFGVLGQGAYDKPVVQVSDRGAHRARTPAMRPDDHQSIRRTRLSLATDGTMSGETEQLATGLFATSARTIAASLQWNGLEKSAENVLRSFGTPGKGRFEIGSLAELGGSYAVRSTFVYDARTSIKPPASHFIPTGLGIQARPGHFVLGARNPVRKLPFVCLAGKQTEEIDLTFAEGLPLPQKITDRRVETRSFAYNAEYRLEDRTLKVRRELVSRVPGQVCAAEIEAEIARPMAEVLASNAARMAFPAPPAAAKPTPPAAAPAASGPLEIKRAAVVDQPLQLDFLYAINPDCSSIGVARIRTIEEPKHGKMAIEQTTGFSNFPQDNPRFACNRRRSEGMLMSYRPEPGYLGPDTVIVEVVYGDGTSRQRRYAITVAPKPPARELKRVAIAEQRVRIGFLSNVEPDCSSTPFADVRIVDAPKHGTAAIEAGTGFTNFEKANSRFECNQQRTDGTAVWYRSDAGYAGPDSVTVEISYVDGRQTSLRYSIEVK